MIFIGTYMLDYQHNMDIRSSYSMLRACMFTPTHVKCWCKINNINKMCTSTVSEKDKNKTTFSWYDIIVGRYSVIMTKNRTTLMPLMVGLELS